MLQRTGRVTTGDGVELAYAESGTGRPLVYVAGWLGHLDLSWELPEERGYLEALARGRRLVRYDRAGTGLSAAASGAPSLEAEVAQLSAVVERLGPEPVDVMGVSLGAPVAAAWAAAHPDRVRRLVLYGGWALGAELSPPSAREHMLGLVGAHWGLGSDVLTAVFAPDLASADRAQLARYQRACAPAETARELLALGYRIDVRGLLGHVASPTLVVHRTGDRAVPVSEGRALAAGIPGARFVELPGRS
ncbi:alpha/beta fold hydrolase, partial [Schumannella luteola]